MDYQVSDPSEDNSDLDSDSEFLPSDTDESEYADFSENEMLDDDESIEETSLEPNVLSIEATSLEPNVLLSKDGTIQYSEEPLPPARGRSASQSFSSRQGPTLFASSKCTDAVSTFLRFIEPLEKTIVEMTNLYGNRQYKIKWIAVDTTTMRAYYGLLLLAGVYRSNGENTTKLFDSKHGRPIFAATMSLARFKEINSCLRFDDKERRDRERDKLAPIRYIFDKWVQRLRISYCVGDFVTVDEQLLPFRGKSPFTQYIPSKPAKYGMKLWVAADAETFYAYNIQAYVGRDRNCATEVNQGQRVVLV